jgi:cysteine-rich repeat protein
MAYVSSAWAGLWLVDVSDPLNPQLAATYDTPGEAYSLAVSGDHVYLGDYNQLLIFCVDTACQAECPPVECGNGILEPGEKCDDGNLIAGDGCDPDCVIEHYSCGNGILEPGEECDDGNLVFGDGCGPFCRLEAPEILPVCLMGTYETPGIAIATAVDAGHVYISDYYMGGIQILDVSDPTSPTFVSSYHTPSLACHLVLTGSYAVVADRDSGLRILDVSNPNVPTLAGRLELPGEVYYLDIEGDHAFVCAGTAGLQIVDISDPTAPSWVGSWPTSDLANAVTVVGSLCYLGHRLDGLEILDVSDPAAPVSVGYLNLDGKAIGISIVGSYAFVAGHRPGMHVVDVSDPTNPTLVTTFPVGDRARDVTVVDGMAYVSSALAGLWVVDVSDPLDPQLAAVYDTPGEAYSLAVSGDYVYLGDYNKLLVLCVDSACQAECPAVECGNGIVEPGEECDDGNLIAGDGCDPLCAWEAPICGNGVLEAGEECDDGNLVAGDGCDPVCQVEPPICGNGILEPGEECDDGNTIAGDGCDASCRSEHEADITLTMRSDTGTDTFFVDVPGSIIFSVDAPAAEEVWAFAFPLVYTFSNGNIMGPVTETGGPAYITFSDKATTAFEALTWHTAHGLAATDPDTTLTGLLNFDMSPWSGSGELWRLTFVPLDTGQITIDSATVPPGVPVEVVGSDAGYLPFTWQPGTFEVLPGVPTGDVNNDLVLTSSDVISLVSYSFKSGAPPALCEAVGDVNCSGTVTASDIIALVNHVFKSGGRPCNAGGLIRVGVWDCP